MALSLFGLYSLELPSQWQTRLTEISNRQSGTYVGTALIWVVYLPLWVALAYQLCPGVRCSFNHANDFAKNSKIPGVNLIYLRNCLGY